MRRIAAAGLIGLVSMMRPGIGVADHARPALGVTPTGAQLARRAPPVREAARLIDRDADADDRGLALWGLYVGLLRQGDAAVTRWALALQSVVRSRKGNYLHACWWVLREHSPRRARIFAAGLARRGVAIGPDSGHYENVDYLEREPPPPPLPERVGRTPIGYYVDDFAAVVYDLSYRPERKGQASKWLQVTYEDGTEQRSNEQFALIVTMAQVSTMTVLPIGLVQPVQVPAAPAMSARAARPAGGSTGAAAPAPSAAQPRAPPRASAPAKTSPPPRTSTLRRRAATPGKRVSRPRKPSAGPRRAARERAARPPRDAGGMTAGDRVRQRTGWPPERPTGRKPDFSEPNAAEWRYQRYRYDAYKDGRGPDDIIPFDRWKRRYFEPAAKGSRPGRPGGPAHVADVKRNLAEPNSFDPRVKVGNRVPDGVGPPGKAQTIRGQRIAPEGNGRVIFESDHFIHNGAMPDSAARGQIRDIRRADPGATIVVTDVARPDARPLIYPPGTQPPPKGHLPRSQAPIVHYP